MTPLEAALSGTFGAARPHAVDFPQSEYEAEKESFDHIAAQHGYRLAGFRLKMAVFTTKPLGPVAPIPSTEDDA